MPLCCSLFETEQVCDNRNFVKKYSQSYLSSMRWYCWIAILMGFTANAQSLGGEAAFSFLKLSGGTQTKALGSVLVAYAGKDLASSNQNPALLTPSMHQFASANISRWPGKIDEYQLTTAIKLKNNQSVLKFDIQYFNYGNISATDAAGNINGSFSPRDYCISLGYSNSYKSRWRYGSQLKFAGSHYQLYAASAVLLDLGLQYTASELGFEAGFSMNNLGVWLKKYNSQSEELPFDVRLGFAQKLRDAPIKLSLNLHTLQRFDILYNDTSFSFSEGNESLSKKNIGKKILSHLVLGTQFYVGNKVELSAAYNFLRGYELNAFNQTNGGNGLSFGLALLLKKLHIRYSSSLYQQQILHSIGLQFSWSGSSM
jgi:hypothetical protein